MTGRCLRRKAGASFSLRLRSAANIIDVWSPDSAAGHLAAEERLFLDLFYLGSERAGFAGTRSGEPAALFEDAMAAKRASVAAGAHQGMRAGVPLAKDDDIPDHKFSLAPLALGALLDNVFRSSERRITITPWCNGNTGDFGSLIQGSNPCGVATCHCGGLRQPEGGGCALRQPATIRTPRPRKGDQRPVSLPGFLVIAFDSPCASRDAIPPFRAPKPLTQPLLSEPVRPCECAPCGRARGSTRGRAGIGCRRTLGRCSARVRSR